MIYFKYVRNAEVPVWLALGWVLSPVGPHVYHHDHSSALMEWSGEGEPPLPGALE